MFEIITFNFQARYSPVMHNGGNWYGHMGSRSYNGGMYSMYHPETMNMGYNDYHMGGPQVSVFCSCSLMC